MIKIILSVISTMLVLIIVIYSFSLYSFYLAAVKENPTSKGLSSFVDDTENPTSVVRASKEARANAAKNLYRKIPGSKYHVLELNDDSFEDTVFPSHIAVTAQRPFLIMFYAPWCQHCKAVLPLFDNASRILHSTDHNFAEHNFKDNSARMAIVDVVTNPKLGHKLHLKSYPTYYYSINGRLYEYNASPSSSSFAQNAISIYRAFKYGSFVDDISSLAQFKGIMAAESPSRPIFTFCAKTRNAKRKAAAASSEGNNNNNNNNNNDPTSKRKGGSSGVGSVPPTRLRLPHDAAKVLNRRLDALSKSGDLYLPQTKDDTTDSSTTRTEDSIAGIRDIDYGFLSDDTQINSALLASSRAKDMRDELAVVAEAFMSNGRARFGVIYEDEAARSDPILQLETSKDSKEAAANKVAYINHKKRLLRPKDRSTDAVTEAMYWSLRYRCQELRIAANNNILSAAAGKVSTHKDWASSTGPYDTLITLLPPPTLGPNDEILLVTSDVSMEEPVHFFGTWGHFTTATEDLLKYTRPNLKTHEERVTATSTVYAGQGYIRSIGSSTFVPSTELDEFTLRYGHRGVEKINTDVLSSLSQRGKVGILAVSGDLNFNTDKKYIPVLQELAIGRFMDYHNDVYDKSGPTEEKVKKVKTMEEIRESVVSSGGESVARVDGMNSHQILSAIGGATSPQFNRVNAIKEAGQFLRTTAAENMKRVRDTSMTSIAVIDGIVYEAWLISLGYSTTRRLPLFSVVDPVKEIVWIMEEWLSPENRKILLSEEPYGVFGSPQLEALRDFLAAVDAGDIRGTPLTLLGTIVYFILEYIPLTYILYEFVGADNGVFIGGIVAITSSLLMIILTFYNKPADELYDHSRHQPIISSPQRQSSKVKRG